MRRPAFQLHLRDVVSSHVEAPVLFESRRWCRIYVVRRTQRSGRPPLPSSPVAVLARLPCPPATGSTSDGRNGNRSPPPVRRLPRSGSPASAAPLARAAPEFGKRTWRDVAVCRGRQSCSPTHIPFTSGQKHTHICRCVVFTFENYIGIMCLNKVISSFSCSHSNTRTETRILMFHTPGTTPSQRYFAECLSVRMPVCITRVRPLLSCRALSITISH